MKNLMKNIKAAPTAKEVRTAGKLKTAKKALAVAKKDVTKAVAKASQPEAAAPITPLTKAFIKAGFVHARTQAADEQTVAHGYAHSDGSAVMFVHANISLDVAAKWMLKKADGSSAEGVTAKEFVTALQVKPELSTHVQAALTLLKKLTKGLYRLSALAGDDNYSARVQLFKKLRNTDKVLVKTSGVNVLIKEFYAALNIPQASTAGMESVFAAKCLEFFKQESKAKTAVAKVEKEEIAATVAKSAHTRVVGGGKPILDAPKKMTKKQEAADSLQFKAALAAKVRRADAELSIAPIAVPKPEANVQVCLEDVCLLEDPNNGIVMLRLEKPNSQGAICVYNNGSRVAAGVVPTEVLNSLRRLISTDLIRDVNQLLSPLTAGVVVTSMAHRHLTAVLDRCKENLPMANETATKKAKFAAPTGVAKKGAKVATPKTATAKKTAHDKAERAPRVTEDRKIKALITAKDKDRMPREGSFCYGQVQAVIGSKSVSEAQAKLDASGLNPASRKLEVAWLAKQGFIEVAA